MDKHMTVCEFLERFKNGEFDSSDVNTQIEAGWFDWFCRDRALVNKTKDLAAKISQIMHSKLFDPNNTYVFFKNNCPLYGKKYDSFGINDIDTGDNILYVSPKMGHDNAQLKDKALVVVDSEEHFFDSWQEAKDFINA